MHIACSLQAGLGVTVVTPPLSPKTPLRKGRTAVSPPASPRPSAGELEEFLMDVDFPGHKDKLIPLALKALDFNMIQACSVQQCSSESFA